MSDAAPPSIDAVTVFDIHRECDALGCCAPPEVALVAQLAGGGFAMRWVCLKHEAGAIPAGLAEVIIARAPRAEEIH